MSPRPFTLSSTEVYDAHHVASDRLGLPNAIDPVTITLKPGVRVGYDASMVLPRWLARFNRRVTNHVLGRLPRRWSPFVVVHHVGRTSGKQYATPLMAFGTDTGFVFALTYGPNADWVRNVSTADSFLIDVRGTPHTLTNARLIARRQAWPHLPHVVRLILRLLRLEWFLAADEA